MLAALDRGSRTLAALTAARRFAVNVLAAGQEELARSFASKAPHPEKWAEVAFTERDGLPVIDGAVLWVACDLRDLHEGGDHVIATGAVTAIGSDGADRAPLVFHRGSYRGLA
jgi:flavin reductase (DIM6/NTAB) family NADH-FMN oxidoreductase RutF